jgi:hypothetical protein
MMIDGSNSNTLALPSSEDAYVLIVEAYHSKNKARKDPRNLPEFKDLSTCLRVITVRLTPFVFISFPQQLIPPDFSAERQVSRFQDIHGNTTVS